MIAPAPIMVCSLCKESGHNRRTCKKKQYASVVIPPAPAPAPPPAPAPACAETPDKSVSDGYRNQMEGDEKTERVRRLLEHLALTRVVHEEQIMKQPTLKDAHIYCVIYGISAQEYGPLLETYISKKYKYVKNRASECTGDCSKNGENVEIKVSLGGKTHSKFNYVQIRPSHACDAYLLTAYHLSHENVDMEGELYVFKIPKGEMINLLVRHGQYAHGTVKEHGRITMETMNDPKNIKEYALRPKINDECWKALHAFRIVVDDI